MDDDTKEVISIPFIAHEAAMERQVREHEKERESKDAVIKKLWILCIIIFSALVISNICWIHYENQFEDVVTVSQDAQTGDAPIYLNGTGEQTVNGQSKTDSY